MPTRSNKDISVSSHAVDGEIEDIHSSKEEGDKVFSLILLICELISDVITIENLQETMKLKV